MGYCDYFKTMFNSRKKPNKIKKKIQDLVELKDLNINAFVHFLNLINREAEISGKFKLVNL